MTPHCDHPSLRSNFATVLSVWSEPKVGIEVLASHSQILSLVCHLGGLGLWCIFLIAHFGRILRCFFPWILMSILYEDYIRFEVCYSLMKFLIGDFFFFSFSPSLPSIYLSCPKRAVPCCKYTPAVTLQKVVDLSFSWKYFAEYCRLELRESRK